MSVVMYGNTVFLTWAIVGYGLHRFMKLRLDRVLKADLSGMADQEIFNSACNYELPPFQQPLGSKKWTAPYSPYEPGWWEAFYKK